MWVLAHCCNAMGLVITDKTKFIYFLSPILQLLPTLIGNDCNKKQHNHDKNHLADCF